MATKNPVNQATARATLTQIISIIFQRMEQNAMDAVVALSTSPASLTSPVADTSAIHSVDVTEDSDSPTIIQVCETPLSDNIRNTKIRTTSHIFTSVEKIRRAVQLQYSYTSLESEKS